MNNWSTVVNLEVLFNETSIYQMLKKCVDLGFILLYSEEYLRSSKILDADKVTQKVLEAQQSGNTVYLCIHKNSEIWFYLNIEPNEKNTKVTISENPPERIFPLYEKGYDEYIDLAEHIRIIFNITQDFKVISCKNEKFES